MNIKREVGNGPFWLELGSVSGLQYSSSGALVYDVIKDLVSLFLRGEKEKQINFQKYRKSRIGCP
jgi:hypothetical protein